MNYALLVKNMNNFSQIVKKSVKRCAKKSRVIFFRVWSIPEVPVCQELGIELIGGLGNKFQYSSWLLTNR